MNIDGETGLSSSPSIKVIVKDEFVDDVLALLKLLTARKGWNNEAKLNQKKLWALLDSKDYISFTAGYSDYIASVIGDSYLYDVPMYKRGYLSKLRGGKMDSCRGAQYCSPRVVICRKKRNGRCVVSSLLNTRACKVRSQSV